MDSKKQKKPNQPTLTSTVFLNTCYKRLKLWKKSVDSDITDVALFLSY